LRVPPPTRPPRWFHDRRQRIVPGESDGQFFEQEQSARVGDTRGSQDVRSVGQAGAREQDGGRAVANCDPVQRRWQ